MRNASKTPSVRYVINAVVICWYVLRSPHDLDDKGFRSSIGALSFLSLVVSFFRIKTVLRRAFY